MKRNNKGFTLVELLAAIIIMGILMAFSIPTIFKMLDENKDKMYIDVTKKLVAQAEYKMRESSSTIEKPEEGETIVMSMIYLDSNDFDNTPNNGEYLKEASFVVIKNIGGNKLEYSATVVEKMKKGGYKGVQLTKSDNLFAKDAIKYVQVINEDDITYVESSDDKSSLTVNYINNYMGNNYCNNIEMIYNYPGLLENEDSEKNNPPKITSVKINSRDNKNINSFYTTLIVGANDDKTIRKNLTVHTSLKSYEDALASQGKVYGDNDYYKEDLDFSDICGNKYEGQTIKVYVVVKDLENNFAKKDVIYTVHRNKAPIINTSTSLSKQTSDLKNMPKAVLKLDVLDDVDLKGDLNVCLVEGDLGVDSCTKYQKYSNLFGSKGTYIYDFGGKPDGRKMKLTVCVKDSDGNIAKKVLAYNIYNNTGAEIKSMEAFSEEESFTDSSEYAEKGGSLSLKLKIDAEHALSLDNINLKITCRDKRTGDSCNDDVLGDYNYGNYDDYLYTIKGEYDGSTKIIKATLTDEYGRATSKEIEYKLYKNKVPKIESKTVTSSKMMCSNEDEDCGGSLDTIINFNVSDDIDGYADLLVCVSDDIEHCKNAENFVSYAEYYNRDVNFTLEPRDSQKAYDGSEKNIYFYVKDSYGEVTNSKYEYKLYKNEAPVFFEDDKEENLNGIEITSLEDININKASLVINVTDDLDNSDDLKVQVCKKLKDKSNENCVIKGGDEGDANDTWISNKDLGDIITFGAEDGFSGKYKGQEYEVIVRVKDSYGEITESSVNYKLFEDTVPSIDIFEVFSGTSNSVINDANTGGINYSSINDEHINIKYKVLDPYDSYSICIGTEENYDSCVRNSPIYREDNIRNEEIDITNSNIIYSFPKDESQDSGELNLEKFILNENLNLDNIEFSHEKDNKNRKKTFYLNVKDSNGEVASKDFFYELYEECLAPKKPTDTDSEDPDFSRVFEAEDSSKIISAKACKGKCYIDGNENNVTFNYFHRYSYFDRFLDNTKCVKNDNKLEEKSCDFYKCFMRYDENELKNLSDNDKYEIIVDKDNNRIEVDKTNSFYLAIGKKEFKGNYTHYVYVNGEEVEHIHDTYYKVYKVKYDKYDMIVELSVLDEKFCPEEFKAWSFKIPANDSNENIRKENNYVLVDNFDDYGEEEENNEEVR